MEKVKLPKDVNLAIWEARRMYLDDEILATHGKNPRGWNAPLEPLRKLSLMDLATALVIGFESEETPEDKVRAIYKLWNEWDGNDGMFSSQTIASIIVDVVDALGKKIEGVNV